MTFRVIDIEEDAVHEDEAHEYAAHKRNSREHAKECFFTNKIDFFMQNLHMSKKSSTFAGFLCTKMIALIRSFKRTI